MAASSPSRTRPYILAATLAQAFVACMLPAAATHAESSSAATTLPALLVRVSEPEQVGAAASALRTACAAWQKQPLAGSQSGDVSHLHIPPPLSDSNLCDYAEDSARVEWSIGLSSALLTLFGFIIAAAFAGVLRMILVAAWAWRPRRNLEPWA